MPGPEVPTNVPHDVRWLSLGPASRLLGIDPDTLRRWADQGRVPSWTTPGGHRRFERSELERIAVAHGRATPPALTSLGASPERIARVYREHYASVPASGAPKPPATSDEAARAAYRRDGRRLIEALIEYLDTDARDGESRDRLERRARSIVDHQAKRLAADGAGLTEAVSGFIGARGPFLAELAGLGRRRSLDPAHLAGLYGDASALLDRLLLRFIAAYRRSDA